MSESDLEYNELKENIILIKKNLKTKGNQYGTIKLNKRQVELLLQSIDLMTSSPEIKPKFHQKIETYLNPRFMEISGIIYTTKALENEVYIEMDKINQKELLIALDLTSVLERLQSKRPELEQIKKNLKNMQFNKYKS